MRELLAALDGVESASIGRFQRAVNLTRGQLDQALKQLELDGAVTKTGGRWSRTALDWEPDEERIERVTATRRAELEQMRAYVTTKECRMAFLTGLLDDPATAVCGRCANDVGKGMAHTVDADRTRAAIDFLRRSLRPIEPRKRWVEGAAGVGESPGSTVIAAPNEAGIALCVAGDAGWGREIVRARGGVGRFPDGLVVAATRAIRDQWRPDVPPEWVTSVPSTTADGILRGFAEALAAEFGLPYVAALRLASASGGAAPRPQKAMQNSVLQLENAKAKLAVDASAVLPGAVLLVDDLVDSRWTLTIAGSLLRAAGSGPVLPFALAEASAREG
jgi:ATP-dependent DNA helicase RecQ